jgi:hypothetical protein
MRADSEELSQLKNQNETTCHLLFPQRATCCSDNGKVRVPMCDAITKLFWVKKAVIVKPSALATPPERPHRRVYGYRTFIGGIRPT